MRFYAALNQYLVDLAAYGKSLDECMQQPPPPPPPPSPPPKPQPGFSVPPKLPSDPNNIVGPAGYGDQGFVSLTQPLGYEILFENEPDAAPAQQVVVTEQLDPSLDWARSASETSASAA